MTRDRGQTTALARVRRGLPVHAAPTAGVADDAQAREDLQVALLAGDLSVHLQPQVSLADGRTVGVEALVRWEHPSRGVLAPRDLLPVAERAGLHGALVDVVLDLALGSAVRWWSHRAPLPVSVNLAAANVCDLSLPTGVAAALARHGLPPRALTVEVGEDILVGTTDRALRVLAELRALGVAVAIDDYGSGHSPLGALRHVPADELKLDPVLVAEVGTDERSAAVVRHLAALAHALGLRVVAEGVEDAVTLARLAELGCDLTQGFLHGRPVPADEFRLELAPA